MLLAEYFTGQWAGDVGKPYELSSELVEQFHVPKRGTAVRHVAPQPLVYPSGSPLGVVIDGTR